MAGTEGEKERKSGRASVKGSESVHIRVSTDGCPLGDSERRPRPIVPRFRYTRVSRLAWIERDRRDALRLAR